ncbi:hypothetical protein BH09BAC3_BH09BAC3_19310 [soil metagenome]
MRNIGILLIVIGAIMMAITGFNFVTREKVVDLGDVHISKTENHPVQWSPIVGGVLLVAGFAMVLANKKG